MPDIGMACFLDFFSPDTFQYALILIAFYYSCWVMGLFYSVLDKKLLADRVEIFKEVGIPALFKNNFQFDTFKTSWHGQYDRSIQGHIFQISRLKVEKYLERIDVYILKGERWIQIFLNVFELRPNLSSISKLKEHEGLKFGIPPNSSTKMRLRSDEYNGPPLFYMLFLPQHKLGNYFTKDGYKSEIEKFKSLIKNDMENIDRFIKRWHELYKPNLTDWEGNNVMSR
jgi:hypothetical protein